MTRPARRAAGTSHETVRSPPRLPLIAGGSAPRQAASQARLRTAALELFASRGYETTTVDEIAQRAGVSRRTYFRHFSSKEEVIFPDHDRLLVAVEDSLAVLPTDRPVASACAAMRIVFDSYLDEPEVALQRYRLTHAIPALRDREIASVFRYQRLLTGYLGAQYGRSAAAGLRAELAGAAVTTAHNHVLRRWLRRGCKGRPLAELDRAFALVGGTLEPTGVTAATDREVQRLEGGDSVIAVLRTGLPLEEIQRRLSGPP